MRIINLTGHDVVIITQAGNITIPKIAWFKLQLPLVVKQIDVVLDNVSDWVIPLYDYEYTAPTELLEIFAPIKEGTIYVCSRVVAETSMRKDFYITGQHIKIDGKVIGTKGLQKNPYLRFQ